MRQAQMLHFIICSLLVVVNIQSVIFFFLLPEHWSRWLGNFLTASITLPLLLFLNHTGRTRLTAGLLMAEIWLMVTILCLTGNGIHDPLVFAYTIGVLVAGLVFGERGGVIAAVLFGLSALGVTLVENANLFPRATIAYTRIALWSLVAMYLEFFATFQYLANRSVKRALNQAREAEAALVETQQRYREVFDTTSDCIFLVDVTIDGRFVCYNYNPACAQVIGLTAVEVAGRTPDQVFPPDMAQAAIERYQSCVAQGSRMDYDEPIVSVHGRHYWFHTTLIPVKNAEGRVFRMVGVAHDITERRKAQEALVRSRDELELRVQERTTELRNTNEELRNVNKELETFSYSVSHDLRRPLRTINGFAELLMSDHAGQLSGEALELLSMIRDSARQMSQLIDALLKLSQIERQALVPRPVDLNELVKETLKGLQPEYANRNIEFREADLPQCMGDAALLLQVYSNILGNSIKYTRNRSVAIIEIGFKNIGGEVVYFVKDNGAGFDMKYAGKLFGVFQRLHSASEFSGTGVGLSTVRRIIHRHGGKIWAEAEVDKGATFYFTLPQVPKPPRMANELKGSHAHSQTSQRTDIPR